MSVVGLTLGTAAKAIRPSAPNAARVATRATIRASGRTRSYQAKPPARAEAEEAEGAELPAHTVLTSGPATLSRSFGSAARACSGVRIDSHPPRIRAVSVAK